MSMAGSCLVQSLQIMFVGKGARRQKISCPLKNITMFVVENSVFFLRVIIFCWQRIVFLWCSLTPCYIIVCLLNVTIPFTFSSKYYLLSFFCLSLIYLMKTNPTKPIWKLSWGIKKISLKCPVANFSLCTFKWRECLWLNNSSGRSFFYQIETQPQHSIYHRVLVRLSLEQICLHFSFIKI